MGSFFNVMFSFFFIGLLPRLKGADFLRFEDGGVHARFAGRRGGELTYLCGLIGSLLLDVPLS